MCVTLISTPSYLAAGTALLSVATTFKVNTWPDVSSDDVTVLTVIAPDEASTAKVPVCVCVRV